MSERKANHAIDPLFLNRWSPYSFTGEAITDEQIKILFESARWAPSSYNAQPWCFIYAKRDTPAWERLYNLLVEFNQGWVKNTALLAVVCSRDTFEFNGKPARTHSYDTGSAWQNLALQAALMGLAAHGMEGFSYKRAKEELHIPDGYTVEAMFAVGKPGPAPELAPEYLEKNKQSDRKPLEEFAFEGFFKQ